MYVCVLLLSRLLITAAMPGPELPRQCSGRLSSLPPTPPPGLHFGAAAAALKDMVESATAALLLFFSPFQNSTAIITVGPARPTPEEGFCVYVCCYKDRGLEFETLFFFFLVRFGAPTNHFTIP